MFKLDNFLYLYACVYVYIEFLFYHSTTPQTTLVEYAFVGLSSSVFIYYTHIAITLSDQCNVGGYRV